MRKEVGICKKETRSKYTEMKVRMMKMCDFFFFFKQKTAYEMRISDWSSDVCSSDLIDACHDGAFNAVPAAIRNVAASSTNGVVIAANVSPVSTVATTSIADCAISMMFRRS